MRAESSVRLWTQKEKAEGLTFWFMAGEWWKRLSWNFDLFDLLLNWLL